MSPTVQSGYGNNKPHIHCLMDEWMDGGGGSGPGGKCGTDSGGMYRGKMQNNTPLAKRGI